MINEKIKINEQNCANLRTLKKANLDFCTHLLIFKLVFNMKKLAKNSVCLRRMTSSTTSKMLRFHFNEKIKTKIGIERGWPTFGALHHCCDCNRARWWTSIFLSISCIIQFPCEIPVIILKQAVHDFLEEKTGHLGKEFFYVIILGHVIWNFYMVLLTISIIWLWNCNEKTYCFLALVNDIIAFQMKLKLLISQLENEDMSQFSYLKNRLNVLLIITI